MTIEEIINSEKTLLTAEDIAPIIGSNPQALRITAREHPERLGFPAVCPTEHTVKFPRLPFLAFLGIKEKPATNGELHATNTLE